MIGPPHGKDRERYEQAFRLLEDEIRSQARQIADSDAEVDEIVQRQLTKFIRTSSAPAEPLSDDEARAAVSRSVKRMFSTLKREHQRTQNHEIGEVSLNSGGDEEVEGNIDDVVGNDRPQIQHQRVSEKWLEIDEKLEESALFDSDLPVDQMAERAHNFFKERVVDEVVSRSDARANMRQAIDELHQIVEGTIDFDTLVEREVDDSRSDDTRTKARQRVHRRHSNARERIESWLNGPASDSSLTAFDLTILSMTLEGLYVRQSS